MIAQKGAGSNPDPFAWSVPRKLPSNAVWQCAIERNSVVPTASPLVSPLVQTVSQQPTTTRRVEIPIGHG